MRGMAAMVSDLDVQSNKHWLEVVRAVCARANEIGMLYGNMNLHNTCEGLQVATKQQGGGD